MSMIGYLEKETLLRRSNRIGEETECWPGVDTDPGFLSRTLAIDLAFERAVSRNRNLALFQRNCATWELLLVLCAAPETDKPGVYELIEGLRSKGLGQSALLRFVRDRRDDGLLVFDRHARKKSKMHIRLSPAVESALTALLMDRAEAMRTQSARAT